MELKDFKITGLFKRFDHHIRFQDNVTIIIGDNGVGKTVCLKILDSIFNKKFTYLFEICFTSVELSFGKEKWIITKRIEQSENNLLFLQEREMLVVSSNLNGEFVFFKDDHMQRLPPYFTRISENEWLDRRRGITVNEQELYMKYGNRWRDLDLVDLPDWVVKGMSKNRVRLIDTQRIYNLEQSGKSIEIRRMVTKFAEEVTRLIQAERNKAELITAELDRSFPTRLISLLNSKKDVSADNVLNQLKDLANMQANLHNVGLSQYYQDRQIPKLDRIDQPIWRVLSLYADDSARKLHTYDSLLAKLQLFLGVINKRFDYKKCKIDVEKGFVFVSDIDENEIIPLEDLSSGEQNEIVLFYDLLFNCGEKDLILIDEPELSLHIKWQQSMISDLMGICGENNLNLLLATHSPDLIGNHWSLVQKME